MLVAVDVGNSSVKLGAFEGERLIATERVEGGSAASPTPLTEGLIPFPFLFRADVVAVVSSAPRALDALLAALQRPVHVLGDDVRRVVATTYGDSSELGLDRLAAAFGARCLCAPEGGGEAPVVVVDAGTATTVDALDAAGRFVALAIAPGVRSAAAGLRASAPHLPPVTTTEAPELPARGTAAALRTGFVLGIAGLVERLAAEALAVVGETAPLVLTGGDAALLSPHIRREHRVAPDAVLHGIRVLYGMVAP